MKAKAKRFRKDNLGSLCRVNFETRIAYGVIISIDRNNYNADIYFPRHRETYTINRKDVIKIGIQLTEKAFQNSFTVVALKKGFNRPSKRFSLSE